MERQADDKEHDRHVTIIMEDTYKVNFPALRRCLTPGLERKISSAEELNTKM